MAKAKKLPSGSWRCLVYSHSENVLDDDGKLVIEDDGRPKRKRIYESFTSDDPTPAGKREAELLAAQFAREKEIQDKRRIYNITLREAIQKHIESSDALLSPTTLRTYVTIKENSFQNIMDTNLKDLTTSVLQEAVNLEAKRKAKNKKGTLSPKSVRNNYGLVTVVLNKYRPDLDTTVKLPSKVNHIKELLPPEVIFNTVKGTDIELAVLLAMWLSFSMSEIRGLTKSKSVSPDGQYITIHEVVVSIGKKQIRKDQAKTFTRNRRHKIPLYIQELIKNTDPRIDALVPMTAGMIYERFIRVLRKNGLPHMSFHDLRHVNASVMAVLQIPDKYALERGGWKTDGVMKRVYTHTFSRERQDVDNKVDEYFEEVVNGGQEKMDRLRIIKGFDYTVLLALGYIFVPHENGYMSPDAATIVYKNHPEYGRNIMPFIQGREFDHRKNIVLLKELGYLV